MSTTALPAQAYLRPGVTELISVPLPEKPAVLPADGQASSPSNDGRYVAFSTSASDLVLVDALYYDVFVRDRATDTTTLISKSPEGLPGVLPPGPHALTEGAQHPMISADGRFVTYASNYMNLVPGDTNLLWDIFVYDMDSGVTERVSVTSEGNQASERSFGTAVFPGSGEPVINGNGRYVAFTSLAPDLVEDDTNEANDIFLHDRKTHATERVSVTSDGSQTADTGVPNGVGRTDASSYDPSISVTGRFVTFESYADNLSDDDSNNAPDAFLYDTRSGSTKRVSYASDGSEIARGTDNSTSPGASGQHVSRTGRYVIFKSSDGNVVPNDTENRTNAIPLATETDVFWRDLETGRTLLVSLPSTGEQATEGDANLAASISADGRYVFFTSDAQNLSEYDIDDSKFELTGEYDGDAFVHDVVTGATELMSVVSDRPGMHSTHYLGSSPSGRFVTFDASWRIPEPPALPEGDDVYIHDRWGALGVGSLGTGTSSEGGESPPVCVDPDTCVPEVCIAAVCIPPAGARSSLDEPADISTTVAGLDADLYGASLAYRPGLGDLFAAIELEHMGPVVPGLSPLVYGLRFEVEDKSYEIRATSLLGGTFGLFDCTDPVSCTKVTDLRGGYGTTGQRVVFSVPLAEIGLQDGGRLTDVEAFSALGSFLTGAASILDRVSIT